MGLPAEAKLFTQKIAWQNQRIILTTAPRLQESIELRWQSIVAAHPGVTDECILVQILVRDSFDRLLDGAVDPIESDCWRSFLAYLALQVANRILRITYTRLEDLEDIQSICLGTISHLDRFFTGFDLNRNLESDLLSRLKAYGYRSIQYSAYPKVRKFFNDPNIGRSLRGLFNRYSDCMIKDALSNEGGSQTQIERDLRLCKCAREYLRQTGRRIDRLRTQDFDSIGDLYRTIYGDAPPPVAKRLEQIGGAISKFTSPPQIVSSNTLIGSKGSAPNYTLENTLPSAKPQPDEYLESQERSQQWQQLFKLGDRWLSEHTHAHDRDILLLRYGFDLNQTPIGNILKKDQATICRSLRQIHRRIAEHLTQAMNPGADVPSAMVLELTIELLAENFTSFDIYQQIDRTIIQELATSISALTSWMKQTENRQRSLEPELVDRIRRRLERITHK